MPHATTDEAVVIRPLKNTTSSFLNLPLEIIFRIGTNLNTPDQARLVRTCTALANFSMFEKHRYVQCESRKKGTFRKGHILTWAVNHSCTATAEKVIGYGFDVEASTHWDRETPLMMACRNGSLPLIKILVDAGALVNCQDSRDGSSPVMMCAERGDVVGLEYMLDRGGDLHRKTRDEETALHLATRSNRLDVVEFILQHRSPLDINARNIIGATPLHLAVGGNNTDIARVLAKYGADTNARNDDGISVLYSALSSATQLMIPALLENGADANCPDDYGRSVLSWAAQNSLVAKVDQLLEHGADPNYLDIYGKTPIMYAAAFGRRPVLERLLSKGADKSIRDKQGITAYHTAVQYGQYECAEYFLQQGENVDLVSNHGQTPLFRSAEVDDTRTMGILLKYGAEVNTRADDETTPLMIACGNGSLGAVRMLIEHGADVHASDDTGANVLSQAVRGIRDYCEIFRTPHDPFPDGAISQFGPWKGNRFLLHAHDDRIHGLVECMLDDQATVQHTEWIGVSEYFDPLSSRRPKAFWEREANDVRAPFMKWEAILKLLVKKGADVRQGDCNGTSPLDMTSDMGLGAAVRTTLLGTAKDTRRERRGEGSGWLGSVDLG